MPGRGALGGDGVKAGMMVQGRTVRTPEKEAVILEALREHPSFAKAARRGRIARSSLSEWRADDPTFSARCESAREAGLDAVEDALFERATSKDTTAAIFILKTWRKDRYGDKLSVTFDVHAAAERIAADLNIPIDTVLSETYRMVEDGS